MTDLSLLQREVLAELAWCRNQFSGLCCPRMKTLAKKIGVSEKSIERAITTLEKMGWLVVDRVRGYVNKYIVAPVEWLIEKRRDEKFLTEDVCKNEQDVDKDRQNDCHKQKISSSKSPIETLKLRQETNCPPHWLEKAVPAQIEDLPKVVEWRQLADHAQGTMIYLYGKTQAGQVVDLRFRAEFFERILSGKYDYSKWSVWYLEAAYKSGVIEKELYLVLKEKCLQEEKRICIGKLGT